MGAGTTRGVSLAGPISGSEAASESLRLLRPTLLSLAGYFNTTSVSQEAVQVLQVGIMIMSLLLHVYWKPSAGDVAKPGCCRSAPPPAPLQHAISPPQAPFPHPSSLTSPTPFVPFPHHSHPQHLFSLSLITHIPTPSFPLPSSLTPQHPLPSLPPVPGPHFLCHKYPLHPIRNPLSPGIPIPRPGRPNAYLWSRWDVHGNVHHCKPQLPPSFLGDHSR